MAVACHVGVVAADGLLIPGFTLSWAVAKEVNRPEHSGMATAVVNLGVFLGAGILQPLVGWVLDRNRALGDAAHAWDSALLLLAGSAAFGALGGVAGAGPPPDAWARSIDANSDYVICSSTSSPSWIMGIPFS